MYLVWGEDHFNLSTMGNPPKDCDITRDIVTQGAFNFQILFVCIVSSDVCSLILTLQNILRDFGHHGSSLFCRHLVAPNKVTLLVERAICCLRIH